MHAQRTGQSSLYVFVVIRVVHKREEGQVLGPIYIHVTNGASSGFVETCLPATTCGQIRKEHYARTMDHQRHAMPIPKHKTWSYLLPPSTGTIISLNTNSGSSTIQLSHPRPTYSSPLKPRMRLDRFEPLFGVGRPSPSSEVVMP